MRNIHLLPLMILSLSVQSYSALAFYPKTAKDFSLLPPYCEAKLNPKSPSEARSWSKRIGSGFMHTHHFCAGLHTYNFTRSHFPKNKGEKSHIKQLLRVGVIGEINYMELHVKNKKFILFPSIYLLKAKAFADLGETANALTYFNKSIIANKKYSRGHLALSRFYQKLGNKVMAIETVRTGLKYNPRSKALKRQLNRLTKNRSN